LRKQLLVDDFIVAEKSGVVRKLGSVTKANAGKAIFTDGWFYGTVLHDAGASSSGIASRIRGLWLCRFERWTGVRPQSRSCGINFAGDYTLAIEIDPHEADAAHRYIVPTTRRHGRGNRPLRRWHRLDSVHDGKPVTRRAADTYNQVLWEPAGETYRLFTRTDFGSAGGPGENSRDAQHDQLKSQDESRRLEAGPRVDL